MKTDYNSIYQTVEEATDQSLIALNVQLQCAFFKFPLKITFYRYEGINEIMPEKWNDMVMYFICEGLRGSSKKLFLVVKYQ